MTYAAYVWSALAVFAAGLIWDWLAPALTLRSMRRQARRQALLQVKDEQ